MRQPDRGQFVQICGRKAEEAGGKVIRVSPKSTSQQCSGCQRIVPKALSVRWHSCPHCDTELDRDHNAALNILRRYQEQKNGAGSVPTGIRRWVPVEAPARLRMGCFTIGVIACSLPTRWQNTGSGI